MWVPYRYGFEDERQAGHLVVGDVEADELLADGGDHVGEASRRCRAAGRRRGRLRMKVIKGNCFLLLVGGWVHRVKEMPSAKRNRRQIAKVEASGKKAG